MANGLLCGHAYSILDVSCCCCVWFVSLSFVFFFVCQIKNPVTEKGFLGLIGNKRQVLLKVRNPWGSDEVPDKNKCLFLFLTKQKWTGAWSDNSPEWTAATRKQLKHESKNDGIFWMV